MQSETAPLVQELRKTLETRWECLDQVGCVNPNPPAAVVPCWGRLPVKSHHVPVESRLASGLFLPLHVTPLQPKDELDLTATEGYEKERIERTRVSESLLGPI